jgi:hypothetical protein
MPRTYWPRSCSSSCWPVTRLHDLRAIGSGSSASYCIRRRPGQGLKKRATYSKRSPQQPLNWNQNSSPAAIFSALQRAAALARLRRSPPGECGTRQGPAIALTSNAPPGHQDGRRTLALCHAIGSRGPIAAFNSSCPSHIALQPHQQYRRYPILVLPKQSINAILVVGAKNKARCPHQAAPVPLFHDLENLACSHLHRLAQHSEWDHQRRRSGVTNLRHCI